MTLDDISRRELAPMLGGVGAGAAFLFGSSKSSIGAINLELPTDPAGQNQALIRMMGTSGSDRVVWKTKGKIFAIFPDKVELLYGMRGSESTWWKQVDEDSWVRYNSTMSFFEDPETGTFIDEFTSPFNGETLKLNASYIRHKEGEYFTPMGHYYGSMKKIFPDHYPNKPLNLAWLLDSGIIRYQNGSNFPPILPEPSLEYATMFSRVSEVLDPNVETPSGMSAGWNIFSGQRPDYVAMGIPPGHIIWHFDAVKIFSVDKLDTDYLERARAHSELFDQSPEFDEGPSFFERILKRLNKE